jgi:hypothetical protein
MAFEAYHIRYNNLTEVERHRRLFCFLKLQKLRPTFKAKDFHHVPALMYLPELLLSDLRDSIEESIPNELHQQWLLSHIIKKGRLLNRHAFIFISEQLRHLCEKQQQGMYAF